jgi:uncharacterized tellurite resistance protein B-like protein
MIDNILSWLAGDADVATAKPMQLQVALAALLVEAAQSDEHFDDCERDVIGRLLQRRFALSSTEALDVMRQAEAAADNAAELFRFTRVINNRLSNEERVELIEMMWEVAYSDGMLDKFEDSLLRRVGGLIYVSDRERGLARQRVMRRLGLDLPE